MTDKLENPKYRKRLNANQIKVLELLVRFRFGTTDLIARAIDKKNGTVIKSKLNILREQELIDRHYDAQDRLAGRHASYFITAKGARAMENDTKDYVIKRSYRDKNASRALIDHNLAVFNIYCDLKDQYGETLKLFSKTELKNYDYFPQPLPDAFLSYKADDGTKRFFMEFFEAVSPSFVLNRRIKQFVDYYENDEWSETNSEFPALLLVCETHALQQRIEKRALAALKDVDGLTIASTSLSLLKTANAWRTVGDDELKSLPAL